MARKLPPGLTDHERDALMQFYAGHLSAGQLAERLAPPEPAQAPLVVVADGPAEPSSTTTVDAPVISATQASAG